MAEEKLTIDDIKPGSTPAIGTPAGSNGLIIYEYDSNGFAKNRTTLGTSPITNRSFNKDRDPEQTRIGDYYYKNGKLEVVPNSPTDFYNRLSYTNTKGLSAKPKETDFVDLFGSAIVPTIATGGQTGVAAAVGARAAAKGIAGASAIASAGPAALVGLGVTAITSSYEVGKQRQRYKDALEAWNEEQRNAVWEVAGDVITDEDGKAYFVTDYTKAIGANTEYLGADLQKAFSRDVNVWWGNDGRMKVSVNPIFATTDQYKDLIKDISKAYAGLTPDSENAEEALSDIQQYIKTAADQFAFRRQSHTIYRQEVPGASEDVIDDAYTNELGAFVSEKEGEEVPVKVFRNGKIIETTAADVLDHVYEMDKGKRSDYMLELWQKMENPHITDDEKVYIYSEIRLLQLASDNDKAYDNGKTDENGATVKTVNKYKGMLDQDWFVALANTRFAILTAGEISNFLNHVTPWDMTYNNQAGLKRDEALVSALTAIGAATNAAASYAAMQGIEHGIVRPLTGKIGEAFDNTLSNLAARGGWLSDVVGEAQLAAGIIADKLGGISVLTSPLAKTIGWSLSELTYNAVSDTIFDVTKLGVRRLAGEEDAFDELGTELTADFLMDVLIQYGPMGIAGAKSELQNNRLEAAYEPYKANFEKIRADFDAAEMDYTTVKEQLGDMKKGTKKYAAAEQEVKKAEKKYKSALKAYEQERAKVDAALSEALPGLSEELGSMLAGKIAQLESNNVVMWLRRKLTDEKAALSTVAEQAYQKTKDVYYYQAAVNKFQNVQSGINEVLTKMNYLNEYAKGTGEAYVSWQKSLMDISPKGKLTKDQINYMAAVTRLEIFTRLNKGNDAEIKKAEEFYNPYIEKMQGQEKLQMDRLLETTKAYLAKVGESYVNSGAASKKSMKDIENAALGEGYIPLWGKDKYRQMTESYEVPNTLRVGRTFDVEKGMFDPKNTNSPILSAIAYTRNIANNIARNEMAAQLREIAEAGVDDLKLVSNGNIGANKEVQDIIDEVLDRVAKKENTLIDNVMPAEKYRKGLDPLLDFEPNTDLVKKMDSLSRTHQKLQDLAKKSRRETDLAKKQKIAQDIEKQKVKMAQQRVETKAEVDNRIRKAGEHFNKTYKKYGLTVDVENTLTSKEYNDWVNSRLRSGSPRNMDLLKTELAERIEQLAPYVPIKKLNKTMVDKEVTGFRAHAKNRLKKEHPDWSEKKVNAAVNRATNDFRNQYSGAPQKEGVQGDVEEYTGGGYRINYTLNGKDASFYVTGKLAKEVAAEMNSEVVVDRNMMNRFMKEAANVKRLLTTGIDPTRVLPNLIRDTGRALVFSGNQALWVSDNSPFGFRKMFEIEAQAQGYSDEQIQKVFDKLQASQDVSAGATYNEVFSGRKRTSGKRLMEDYVQGEKRGTRFIWNLRYGKRKMLEAPMNMAEAFTRNRVASNAFWEAFFRGKNVYDLDTRIKHAYEAGLNAGRETTMNFARRGETIAKLATYVPYLSQKFSSIESAKIEFLKDPIGVSTRLMLFGSAYMMELSRTLSEEKSRKNYYNLSEYDRDNNLIISLPDGSLITIPVDEAISKIIWPWRRGLETFYNVDPESFQMIMVNGLLNLQPFDLSGFSEGDAFNFGRGIEKLGAELLPSVIQAAYTQTTGRTMYYGSSAEVTKEQLAEYGNYSPTMAEYTTTSANSKHLGWLANALGIPQWRIQQMISDLGGNVGQYVVNMLDKVAKASEDEQGGKDFAEATFKSFTGMDSSQVYYAFSDGVKKLEEQKDKVRGDLISLNEKIALASGDKLVELQKQYAKIKQDFAMDVYDFVAKYINAYEITGGLDKSLANKIWYLVNFGDDDSVAMNQSVESYYRDLAKKQANNEATKYSARTLDQFYDQTRNVYRDASGTWHYSAPYGEQAFYNTIYGQGMKHQVGLRNILEGKVESLSAERSAAYDARSAAANAKDWDTYDKIGAAFDEKLIDAISPYVKKYGADAVIGNSTVLDYLEEWVFVPRSFMKTKRGKNVSLGNGGSTNRAFARPYLKKLFGLSTGYTGSNYVSRPENLVWEEGEE